MTGMKKYNQATHSSTLFQSSLRFDSLLAQVSIPAPIKDARNAIHVKIVAIVFFDTIYSTFIYCIYVLYSHKMDCHSVQLKQQVAMEQQVLSLEVLCVCIQIYGCITVGTTLHVFLDESQYD